ncbi:MAG: hypothetical protein KDA61_00515 [Planctomycetales bacterium]|nr:hypothetical protein [Planctomycetales bacterium]
MKRCLRRGGVQPLVFFASLPIVWGLASAAHGITTSSGQTWDLEPDAWVRGNSADISYFGWDVLDAGQTLGFGAILDDTTPDLGSPTSALQTRFRQGVDGANDPSPTTYGHVSGSGNYYSGFAPTNLADDYISGVTPASAAGGSTTLVLQLLGAAPGAGGQELLAIEDLEFEMLSAGWTLEKSLYGQLPTGTGMYWLEWSAAGGNLPFEVHFTSSSEHRSLDAVLVDTYWNSSDVPTLNSRTSIPEPSAVLLAALAAVALGRRSRVRR